MCSMFTEYSHKLNGKRYFHTTEQSNNVFSFHSFLVDFFFFRWFSFLFKWTKRKAKTKKNHNNILETETFDFLDNILMKWILYRKFNWIAKSSRKSFDSEFGIRENLRFSSASRKFEWIMVPLSCKPLYWIIYCM